MFPEELTKAKYYQTALNDRIPKEQKKIQSSHFYSFSINTIQLTVQRTIDVLIESVCKKLIREIVMRCFKMG